MLHEAVKVSHEAPNVPNTGGDMALERGGELTNGKSDPAEGGRSPAVHGGRETGEKIPIARFNGLIKIRL